MTDSILTVIGGCNGAGKSSFSRAITSKETFSFDYDKVYLEKYNSLYDSDIRDRMAHNMARQVLEESVEKAFNDCTDFTYETNFNSTPLYWPEKFKKAGFRLRLVFFCLNSITEAKRRVQIRVENGGHFVPDDEIIERYNQGFENLNQHWSYFDEVYLFDTSSYKQEPKFLLSIINHKIDQFNNLPEYLSNLVPDIKKLKLLTKAKK
jgi:predicted ABC-type ATPase